MEFIAGWTTFRLLGDVELDILTSMKGLEHISFNECMEYASIADIEGVKIPFLHIDQLIENKRATNRAKDQIDVEVLEQIKLMRANKGFRE